jgi:hypothetical protein
MTNGSHSGSQLPALRGRAGGASVLSIGFEQFKALAAEVARSGMIPGVKDASQAMTLMLICDAQGRHIGEAITRFHVIKNNVSVKSKNQLADFQARGGRVRWITTNNELCHAEFTHPTYHPEPLPITVTLEDLIDNGTATAWNEEKKEYVVRDIYRRNAAAMLRARAVTAAITAIDPGALDGLPATEDGPESPEEVDTVAVATLRDTGPVEDPPADHHQADHHQADASAAPPPAAGGGPLPSEVNSPDRRLYRVIVQDAIALVNKAIKDRLESTPRSEALAQYLLQPSVVHGWLYGEAVKAQLLAAEPGDDPSWPRDGARPAKIGELLRILDGLYSTDREWVRARLSEYFVKHSERVATAAAAVG